MFLDVQPDFQNIAPLFKGKKSSEGGECRPEGNPTQFGYQRVSPTFKPVMRSADEELLPLRKAKADSWTGEELMKKGSTSVHRLISVLMQAALENDGSRMLKLEGKEVKMFTFIADMQGTLSGIAVSYVDGTMDDFFTFKDIECVIVDTYRHIIAVAYKFNTGHVFILE